MTKLLRLLFKFYTEYSGDPRFLSGNAFRHVLSKQINTSVGIFTNVDRLSLPETYQEFYRIRTQKYFAFPHLEKFFDWNTERESFRYFFTPQFVTFDVLNPPEDLVKTIHVLEPFQFGGQRHSGCGAVVLHDSLLIDVDKLPMPRHASHLTLISPMVYFLPFIEKFNCRRERINIWNHGRNNQVDVIAPGQFFRIKPGADISKLAKKGILRKVKSNKALFSQFGFGEFILHNWKGGK